MTQIKDRPLMEADTPVKQLELAAIEAYRAKYPDGTAWQELDASTQYLWVDYAEKQEVKG